MIESLCVCVCVCVCVCEWVSECRVSEELTDTYDGVVEECSSVCESEWVGE
jgi:hypothetical protein